jgi:hypothetical protein
MQHDAHEFLNYLLNTVADLLQGMLWNSAFCIRVYVHQTPARQLAAEKCYVSFTLKLR